MPVLEALLAAGLGAVGSMVSSGINAMSQQGTNETMIELANTAVQRRARDMEAAGINPVMAAGQPAAVPGLTAPKVGNPVQDAQAAMIAQTNVAQTQAQTEKTKAEARSANADAAVKEQLVPYEVRAGMMKPETALAEYSKKKAESLIETYKADNAQRFTELDLKMKELGVTEAEQQIRRLRLAADIAQKEKNWYVVNQIEKILSTLTSVTASGAGAAAMSGLIAF